LLGRKEPASHPGVEQQVGDRSGDLGALKGRDFDVVIDGSGYTLAWFEGQGGPLKAGLDPERERAVLSRLD
jgi:2'-hydroxyisoflavone reductase